jgi:hypothetical protein
MSVKVEGYLKKAEEFEAKAAAAGTGEGKASYENLARCYRQLASHAAKNPPETNEDIEALVKRILGRAP